MHQQNPKKQRGFSLMELLISMVILALLASLIGPKFFGRRGRVQQKTARTQIGMLMAAMAAFRLDVGRYPTQQEGLTALVTNPGSEPELDKWNGPYLKKAVPNDPWGNPYHYSNPGKHGEVDIYTYGQDNQPGGEKQNTDIGSWENPPQQKP